MMTPTQSASSRIPARGYAQRARRDSAHPRRLLPSAAVLSGLVAVVLLSLGTDQLLHVLDVYPPWGQPMHEPGLNLLALAYRSVYAVAGSYIAARFAPHAPMRHALAVGIVGLALSVVGAVVTITRYELGPSWYPIALVLLAMPSAWLGGALNRSANA